MTASPICEVAVIGGGAMGSGIAAQLADAGVRVTLLDVDMALAARGVGRQLTEGGFTDATAAGRIRVGSIADDIAWIRSADWILEAAAERLDVKRAIFQAVEAVRRPSSIVTSTTSTIRRSAIVANMGSEFERDFLITHFFNPPQRMRLLELVSDPTASASSVKALIDFAEQRLGKIIVRARDTPGFIANRIGNFWMASALHHAISLRLEVEQADSMVGRRFGMPAGVFAFLDLVGIDLLPPVWASLKAELPSNDALIAFLQPPELILQMLATGRTGRKSGLGFRRKVAGTKEVLDLATGEYRPEYPVPSADLGTADELRKVLAQDSDGGRFADAVICGTLAYAASLVPTAVETPADADLAMRSGYGWRLGPFELIDALGPRWLADRLERSGHLVPPLLQFMAATAVDVTS